MGNSMLNHALAYADSGDPVFPCWPCRAEDNDGCTHGAKAPLVPRGLYQATTDTDRITRWWTRWPEAMIGLPTGHRFDVLDVDRKPGANGYFALEDLEDAGLIWEGAYKVVDTPSGGCHIYFPASGDMPNSTFGPKGIDLRGLGGYVIAPPSILYGDEGRGIVGEYSVFNERDIEDGEPLDHMAVHRILDPHRTTASGHPVRYEKGGSIGGLKNWLADRREGERNSGLFWAACRALESGHDPAELLDAALDTGLDAHEIRGTVESARRKVARNR